MMHVMRNKEIKIEKEAEKYLDANPSIKEALEIFNVSNQDYYNSVRSTYSPKVTISTKSTTNG